MDLMKVYELWQAGEAAYGAGQHRAAAELYRRATELAEASDEVPGWLKGITRRSLADELTSLERLREALAVLSAMPKTAEGGFRECCVYGGMTDHIEIALRLPVALPRIERAFQQAEDYFRSAGEADWGGRLFHYRAELLSARGRYGEARAAAQEGAAHLRDDCPKLYPSTHMWGLFKISLALGDLDEAERYLEKWVEKYDDEDKRNPVRGAYEYLMRARLARARGRVSGAVEWARLGAQSLASADWGESRVMLGGEQVRAYLLAGQHALAGQLLALLARSRRSESGHRRYDFALLSGDYHLARARAAAGLPQLDDEFGTRGVEASEVSAPSAVRPAAARAERAYGAALKVGAWMDEKLECGWRSAEVGRRLARLAHVARVAGRARAGA